MIITNKLKMDLQKPGSTPTISAVQNDSYSRNLEIALYAGHRPYAFPDSGTVVIRYRKSDGKGGEYDTLPDGSIAWQAKQNILTVALAPQVLTTPGSVLLSVSLIDGGTQISMIPIRLAVEPIAASALAESADYFYITGLLPAPSSGKPGQLLQIAAINDSGRITAIEGFDYWTDAHRESIVQDVITALGTPVFGSVDEENNIILTGTLAAGTYTLKYEDADGNVTSIGTLEHGTDPQSYTNLIPLSIDSNGAPYNDGQGWKAGYRLNSSGNEVENEKTEITGFISAKYQDILRLYNITFYGEAQSVYLCFYDSSFTFLGYCKPHNETINSNVTSGIPLDTSDLTSIGFHESNFTGDVTETAYIRLCCYEIDANSIVTINEEVPA